MTDKSITLEVLEALANGIDQTSCEVFLRGEKIPALGHKNQRTSGTIRLRLEKLGLVDKNNRQ